MKIVLLYFLYSSVSGGVLDGEEAVRLMQTAATSVQHNVEPKDEKDVDNGVLCRKRNGVGCRQNNLKQKTVSREKMATIASCEVEALNSRGDQRENVIGYEWLRVKCDVDKDYSSRCSEICSRFEGVEDAQWIDDHDLFDEADAGTSPVKIEPSGPSEETYSSTSDDVRHNTVSGNSTVTLAEDKDACALVSPGKQAFDGLPHDQCNTRGECERPSEHSTQETSAGRFCFATDAGRRRTLPAASRRLGVNRQWCYCHDKKASWNCRYYHGDEPQFKDTEACVATRLSCGRDEPPRAELPLAKDVSYSWPGTCLATYHGIGSGRWRLWFPAPKRFMGFLFLAEPRYVDRINYVRVSIGNEAPKSFDWTKPRYTCTVTKGIQPTQPRWFLCDYDGYYRSIQGTMVELMHLKGDHLSFCGLRIWTMD